MRSPMTPLMRPVAINAMRKMLAPVGISQIPLPYLRGVNYLSFGSGPGEQLPRTEGTAYYADKGMNVFRLACNWETLQPVLNGPLITGGATDWLGGMRSVIEDVTARGGYTIIDLHNYMRRKEGGVDYIIGETATVTAAHLADFWGKLANYFKEYPKVIWGLMNEPHDQAYPALVTTSNAAIAAIRATGSKHPIFVCPNDWNSAGWRAGSQNPTYMLQIVDSADNMVFDVHHYFDAYSAGQSINVVAQSEWMEGLTNVTTWARTNNRKLFCGEFAYPQTQAGIAAGKVFHDYLVANNDVWTGWCHLAGGGWWQYDYFFRLDPYGSKWDASNPFGASGTGQANTWTPIIDQIAMSLVDNYLPITPASNLIPKSRLHADDYFVSSGLSKIIYSDIDGAYGKASNGTGMARIVEDGSNGTHFLQRATVPITSGVNHVLSAIVKPGDTAQTTYQLWAFASDYSSYATAVFNKSGMAYQYGFGGGGGTFVNGGTISIGNGEYLVWIEFSLASSGVNLRLQGTGGNYTGVAGATLAWVDGMYLQQRTGAPVLSSLRVTNPEATPVVFAPNISALVISGSTTQGQTLTATPTATGNPAPTYTYQWKANGTNISGATANTYVLTANEVGKTITVSAVADNLNGTTAAFTSAATVAIGGLTPWAPTDLGANLLSWYRKDTATVSAWPDSSGNGLNFVQATTGSQPTVDAAGGLAFSATARFMDCAGIDGGTPAFTEGVVVAVSLADTTTNKQILGCASGNGRQLIAQSNAFVWLNQQGTAAIAARAYTAGKQIVTLVSGPTRANIGLSVNGGALDAPVGTQAPYAGTGLVSRIGGTGALSIHEMVRFHAQNTSVADRKKLEGYIAWTNGTVAALDAAHPYKSAAPTV